MPPARTGGQPPGSLCDGLTASRTASRRRSRAILPATARRTAGRNTAPDGGRRTRDSLYSPTATASQRVQPRSLTARENSATARRRDGVYIQPRRQPIKLYSPRRTATDGDSVRGYHSPRQRANYKPWKRSTAPAADIIRAAALYVFIRAFYSLRAGRAKSVYKTVYSPRTGCKPF